MTLRTRKGTKGPENRKPHPPNQLVRMRSPVQIRIAAPQKPLFSLEKGGFILLFVTFWLVLWSGFDHRTSHRKKNQGSGGAVPPEPCAFRELPVGSLCKCRYKTGVCAIIPKVTYGCDI